MADSVRRTETVKFKSGILHAGGSAVGDRVADNHVLYHFFTFLLDFGLIGVNIHEQSFLGNGKMKRE